MPSPRWGVLYWIVAVAACAVMLARSYAPAWSARLLAGAVVALVCVALIRWIRANRVALDTLEWCECAAATMRVRLITSESWVAGAGIPESSRRREALHEGLHAFHLLDERREMACDCRIPVRHWNEELNACIDDRQRVAELVGHAVHETAEDGKLVV
jgi:hypothetical protein